MDLFAGHFSILPGRQWDAASLALLSGVAIQTDGKVVLAGDHLVTSTGTLENALIRLNQTAYSIPHLVPAESYSINCLPMRRGIIKYHPIRRQDRCRRDNCGHNECELQYGKQPHVEPLSSSIVSPISSGPNQRSLEREPPKAIHVPRPQSVVGWFPRFDGKRKPQVSRRFEAAKAHP